MKKLGKIYNTDKNVYVAAKERISYIFDNFEKIVISLSGGKDSSVLTYLALEEAEKRNRKIYCFFLDQEMEYNSTFMFVDELMKHPNIIPLWFQIHGILPTAINHNKYWLEPWNPNEKEKWIRSQKRISIKKIDWEHSVKWSFPEQEKMGFYGFMKCMEQMFKDDNVAHLIGLRAEESLNRFRAVTKSSGYKNIMWSTKNKYGGIKFYPIYDWTFQDLWVYIGKNKKKYNKMYDYFWKRGYSLKDMRISSLMNRKAFQCLVDIQEFEPKLYDKLLDRCEGVKTATLYAKEDKIFKTNKIPENFKTWLEYRNFLLKTLPNQDHVEIFKKRFEKQKKNEYVYKQQVYQIQIHDITNSKKINNVEDPKIETRKKWMDVL